MNDEELSDAWTTLKPTVRRRRRIDAHVFAWLEARDTPLTAEWLGLFRVAVRSARSCHGERGLDRHSDTARLVRACADVNAELDKYLGPVSPS